MPTMVSGSHQPSKTQHVDSGWTGGGWGPSFCPGGLILPVGSTWNSPFWPVNVSSLFLFGGVPSPGQCDSVSALEPALRKLAFSLKCNGQACSHRLLGLLVPVT